MRKVSRTLLTALAGATLSVAACGDDPTGVTGGDELTQIEVDEIFTEIFDQLAQLFVLRRCQRCRRWARRLSLA